MKHDTHDTPAAPVDISIAATLPEIMPVATGADITAGNGGQSRPWPVPWLVALALVVAFGYLSDRRRAALGDFLNQIAEVLRDFRGYDPVV